MRKSTRKSVMEDLQDFDPLSQNKHDFMEVTEWENREGFDVQISSWKNQMFSMTWGEYKLLKRLIKEFN